MFKRFALLAASALFLHCGSASAVQTKIAMGLGHNLFIDGGNVYGFGLTTYGSNPMGAVVPGSLAKEYLIPVFTGVKNAKSVAVGRRRSAALINDGSVLLWGMTSTGIAAAAPYSPPVFGVVSDIAISEYDFYYVVNGELYKWSFAGSATKISSAAHGLVTSIAAGTDYVVALFSDGSIGTYGKNAYGQLGNGTTSQNLTMTKVIGISNATSVAAGAYTTVVTLNSSTVIGFGRNQYGQLGTGDISNKLSPVVIQNISNVSKITVCDGYLLALTSTGSIKVSGWHNLIMGALNLNNSTFVDVPGVAGVVDIANGTAGTLLSLGNAGHLSGAGGGSYTIGDGTKVEKHTFVDISYAVLPSSIISQVAKPICTINATPSVIVSGETSTLTASCTPAATSYVWTGGSCAGSTLATCTVAPSANTTYTLAGSNAGGTGAAASAIVTVTPPVNVPSCGGSSAANPFGSCPTTYTSMNECLKSNPTVRNPGEFCKNRIVPADRGIGNDKKL